MISETKICQNCKQNFVIAPEDFAFYEKIHVPAPTFCPECRTQRRMVFRNEFLLYKKKSAFSGEEIFSMFPPLSYPKVYENKKWYSDEWDPMQFGKEVDFTLPIIEQVFELLKLVPHAARSVSESTLINSDYSNNANHLKNCYLVFNAAHDENCIYGNDIYNSKDSIDNLTIKQTEFSYGNFLVTKSSRIFFSSDCENSYDIYFSKNLRGCSNCFGCANLHNKNYYIFNKPYSKEEYLEKIKTFDLGSYKFINETIIKSTNFWLNFPNQYLHIRTNVNSRGSEYVYNSKNISNSYYVREAENVKYSQFVITPPAAHIYDQTLFGEGASFDYECLICGLGVNNMKFCRECWSNLHDVQYSMYCQNSSNLFACIGLRNKSYCILNKQYTKEEYEKLVPRIIEHMNTMPYIDKKGRVYKYGEFFPSELSPFSYNETIAQEYFPLTREQAIEQGYSWKDPEPRNYEIQIKNNQIPDHIKDVGDDIINKVIECVHNIRTSDVPRCNEQCTEAFKIIKTELEFYRKMSIPLPRLCPNCRHYQRIKQRNPLRLWHRKCMCVGAQGNPSTGSGHSYRNAAAHFHGSSQCPNEFETSYAPERPEIVYCEACYNSEVV